MSQHPNAVSLALSNYSGFVKCALTFDRTMSTAVKPDQADFAITFGGAPSSILAIAWDGQFLNVITADSYLPATTVSLSYPSRTPRLVASDDIPCNTFSFVQDTDPAKDGSSPDWDAELYGPKPK